MSALLCLYKILASLSQLLTQCCIRRSFLEKAEWWAWPLTHIPTLCAQVAVVFLFKMSFGVWFTMHKEKLKCILEQHSQELVDMVLRACFIVGTHFEVNSLLPFCNHVAMVIHVLRALTQLIKICQNQLRVQTRVAYTFWPQSQCSSPSIVVLG